MTNTERVIGFLAAVLAIVVFVTGKQSLNQWREDPTLSSASTFEKLKGSPDPVVTREPRAEPSHTAVQTATGSATEAALLQTRAFQIRELARLSALGYIKSIAFSPSGDEIISGGGDSVVLKFWDVKSRARIVSLKANIDFVNSIRYSPDGIHLALGCRDGSIRIWDAPKRREVSSIPAHASYVFDVQYNSDGRILASGGYRAPSSKPRREIRIWDMHDGKELARLDDNPGPFAFLPSTQSLAIGDENGMLRVWNVRTRKSETTVPIMSVPIVSLVVSPDGAHIAIAGEDGTIKLVDVPSYKVRGLVGHRAGQLRSISMAFDRGSRLVAATSDSQLGTQVWDILSGVLLARGSYGADAVAFSPDGDFLATGSWDSSIRFWSFKSGTS